MVTENPKDRTVCSVSLYEKYQYVYWEQASLNIPIQIKCKDNYALYLIITLHQQDYPLGT